MASMKASSSSRYTSFNSRSSTQSHKSDPSSSLDTTSSSRALSKHKSSAQPPNFASMVKKFMEKKSTIKSKPTRTTNLIIPADFVAEDLKKTARKGTDFTGLQRRLFGKNLLSGGGVKKEERGNKALTEVKSNSRSLGMVLRSERELLSSNKEQEEEIARLKLMLDAKNTEVEKLKDLCLKQRDEIKALKSAVLFPDVTNSQLQELLEKQGSELKQAKQLIPSLQRQVTSLTGQLQYLAEDLAEVKADKYTSRGCYDAHVSSPQTPSFDQEEAANSLEFSSEDQTTPGSPDDMFLKDLNPCLTPYYSRTKSKEFETMGYGSPFEERLTRNNMPLCHGAGFDSCARKLSKSSDYCTCYNSSGCTSTRATPRSDAQKYTYGKQTPHKLF